LEDGARRTSERHFTPPGEWRQKPSRRRGRLTRRYQIRETKMLKTQAEIDAFLNDLTAVCHKHGIGLAQSATMFLLECDDDERRWRETNNGLIEFT
jgi:hypothetical protein